MQVAFIGDIHGNIDALEAVFRDIESWDIETVVCLGDIVGYGPEPGECARQVAARADVTVMGNHEAMLLGLSAEHLRSLDARVGAPLLLARHQLSVAELTGLRELPIAAEMGDMVAVHASMDDPPAFHYIFERAEARRHFEKQNCGISFHGHTHVPALWVKAGRTVHCLRPSGQPVVLNGDAQYAVNVGSVGQPRDGNPMASYAIYDEKRKTLLHRRVAYDVRAAVQRFIEAGMPEENALRLLQGH